MSVASGTTGIRAKRRHKFSHIAAVVVLLHTPLVANAQSWVCAAEQVTGFKSEGGRWRPGNFVANEKYVLTRSTDRFVVKRLRADVPMTLCEKDFDEFGDLDCRTGFTVFRFNNKTKRFLSAYMMGYAENRPVGDTPTLTIGQCSSL